jgi:hypothetical protein
MCLAVLFMETASGPAEQEKWCIDISHPGRPRVHYVARRSYQMEKHKFGITCPDALFVETAAGPPEHEKLCVDISCLGPTRIHYVNCRSHWI